jgi:hypothetical protein
MLEKFLNQFSLVQRVLTLDELRQKTSENTSLNVMMGQTFDDGQPIDLLKYSLFMMSFQDLLQEDEIDVKSSMLLADHFLTDFNREMTQEEAYRLGKERESFLRRLNTVYQGDVEVLFSSELSRSAKYKGILAKLKTKSEDDEEFRNRLLQAVPEKRRSNPDALKYPFEEVACVASLDTDVKIGPNYELFYDEPARDAAPMVGFNRYIAIHLTNSHLFGNVPNLDEDTVSAINRFGILPYQIQSKGLRNNRVDLGNVNSTKPRDLIQTTEDKESLTDLLVILSLAQQRIEGITDFNLLEGISDYSVADLRNLTSDMFHEYVEKPLDLK